MQIVSEWENKYGIFKMRKKELYENEQFKKN